MAIYMAIIWPFVILYCENTLHFHNKNEAIFSGMGKHEKYTMINHETDLKRNLTKDIRIVFSEKGDQILYKIIILKI